MKRALRIAAIVVVVLLLIAIAVPFLIDANAFKPVLESRLSAALGREVTLGDLSLSLLSGSVTAGGLTVAEDPAFGQEPFLRAESLSATVDMRTLIFERRLNVREFAVNKPETALIQGSGGKWNVSSLGATATAAPAPVQAAAVPSESIDLAVDVIRINDGHIRVSDTTPGSTPTELEAVNLEVRDFSLDSAFPFSLDARVATGGTIGLDGMAGPLSTDLIPFTAQLTIEDLALANNGGTLSAVAQTVAQGPRIRIQGDATVENLKIAPGGSPATKPVQSTFDLSYDRVLRRGAVERFPLRVGEAAVNTAGSFDLTGPNTAVDLKVTGSKVPLTELAALLPALDVVLPAGSTIERGTASVDLTSRGPLNALVTTGNIHLDDTMLANFSISEKLKALERFTGIQAEAKTTIALFDAQVSASPQGKTFEGAVLRIPAIGELTGSGTISPEHNLDFRFLADAGASGGTKIPIRVRGTSSDPSFQVDAAGLARDTIEDIKRDPSKAVDRAKDILDIFKRKK